MSCSVDAVRLTKEVKEKAISYGANLVGVISTAVIDAVPRHWIAWEYQTYTKKTKDYMEDSKSIVVLGYQVWDDIHEIAIPRGNIIEYPAYQRMRLFARRVLRLIQGLGYRGIVYPELLSQKRMAQLAGLGNFGKNSLIINPRYGPWIRLQSILTDAELMPDSPFEDDLCGDCEECIEACPVGALTPYRVDPDRCIEGAYDTRKDFTIFTSKFTEHTPRLTRNSRLMCMTCQKACPYGREERGLT